MSLFLCPKCNNRNVVQSPEGSWICMNCGEKGRLEIPKTKLKR
ncbi:MAG: hypothetical protein Q7K42_06480 [Candidatus Diapherotrites archaeon]|nr:hypothetical protein [Candidatus Diapherotrites archaeon]